MMKLHKKFWLSLLAVALSLTCVFVLAGKIQAAGSNAFGDIDGNGTINQDDAVYLLLHTMFESAYPLNNTPGDIDGNGTVNQDDAVYLLLHTMFESAYPLNPPAGGDQDDEVKPTVGPNGTPIV